jgi:predicted Zn-dependent protease
VEPPHARLARSCHVRVRRGDRAQSALHRRLRRARGHLVAARARAFVRFGWNEDHAGGLAAFRTAIALAPGDAQTHHWYATALTARGDQPQALAGIETARHLNPVSPAILTDRGLILFEAGRMAEAQAALTEVLANEPNLPAAHAYLARVLLACSNAAGFLREALADARLQRDPIVEAIYAPGVDELATVDRAAMLAAVAARAKRAFS